MNWNPIPKSETQRLMESLSISVEAQETILKEAIEILQQCGDPREKESAKAGLAFGYVQSGKTLSFTTVAALARDNGYRLIVLIAGVSTNLLEQSTDRIIDDLQVNGDGGNAWVIVTNPVGQSMQRRVISILEQWDDPMIVSDQKQTLFITVMKNTAHLRNLVNILEGIDLLKVPALIIDDEADQASLNTKARKNQLDGIEREMQTAILHSSTINRRIDELRTALPHHSILQYTATPQANLFINLVDRLSPDFAHVLTPGAGYTGGVTFFKNQPALVYTIPVLDIPSSTNELESAPDSLVQAVMEFFLGACVGFFSKEHNIDTPRNRSMMIHPSRLQLDQSLYFRWVKGIKSFLLESLSSAENKVKSFAIDHFQQLYQGLHSTQHDLPPFNDLITKQLDADRLYTVIKKTRVEEVNSRSGKTPKIAWSDDYSWILVGGQVLDRGFTVEGLTVTYMPRDIGVGNVDTIQQRARFFGYKQPYLGLCRVYLNSTNITAYSSYIDHEEALRGDLSTFNKTGANLDEFPRRVLLEQVYNLARSSVFDQHIDRISLSNRWHYTKVPHATIERSKANLVAWDNFYNSVSEDFTTLAESDLFTPTQMHVSATMSLMYFRDNLLSRLSFINSEDQECFYNLMTVINIALQADPQSRTTVFLMGGGMVRSRSVNKLGHVNNLFQGENKATNYPGDRRILDPDHMTFQIRKLLVTDPEYISSVLTLALAWKKPLSLTKSLATQGSLITPRS